MVFVSRPLSCGFEMDWVEIGRGVFKLIGGSYHIFPGAKKKVGFSETHFSTAFSSF